MVCDINDVDIYEIDKDAAKGKKTYVFIMIKLVVASNTNHGEDRLECKKW